MKKEIAPNNEVKKYSIMVIVFVISIVLIGVSLSYAYFSAKFTGNASTPTAKAAIMNVTTSLVTAQAINSDKLAIIDPADYKEKSEKVAFTVTNENTSNVNAKYTIKIDDMSLSKNLFSKYFKWELTINEGTANEKVFQGNFEDASVTPEGTEDKSMLTGLSKILVTDEQALSLNINQTDDIKFYIWLENDENVNQIYLTEGTFNGKLSMNAVPTKD